MLQTTLERGMGAMKRDLVQGGVSILHKNRAVWLTRGEMEEQTLWEWFNCRSGSGEGGDTM